MNSTPVILSGFADEAANDKQAVQQFAALAAAGLQYYSIRFIDVGEGIKNAMALSKSELKTVVKLQQEYGLSVASMGSPIGKVRLLEVDDGTNNKFIPFKKYLQTDVKHACEVANTLAGNARKVFGPDLDISVPTRLLGAQGIMARVRQRPYVITFRWNRYPALVCVDLERR